MLGSGELKPRGGDLEERLEMALSATNAAIWDADPVAGTCWWSDSFFRMLGFDQPPSAPAPDFWRARLHPADAERVQAVIDAHLKGATEVYKYDYRLRREDGGWIWIEASGRCRRDATGRAVRYAGIMVDITALKQQEERALASEERLFQILELSPIACNITTREGRFIYCNPQLPKLLGVSREEMKTVNAETLYADPHTRRKLIGRFEAEGAFRDVEITFRRQSDGALLWLLSSWDSIDYDGEPALLTWLYDITDRKIAESEMMTARDAAERALADLRSAQESLIQAEAMASLGQLVAGVTHDLNTPIGIGVTAASHLTHEVKRMRDAFEAGALKKSQLTDFFNMLEESSRLISVNMARAADLVQSFKRVAVDQSSGDRRSFDLAGYMAEIIHALGPRLKRTGVTVNLTCPDNIVMDSFPGALSQVLTNLVVNALVHAYDEGERSGAIDVTAAPDGEEFVVIEVADHGVGMDKEHSGRIFEAFFSTRRDRGGSGLGLHIVETLVTGPLGGKVGVESAPGVGTTFRVALPRRAD
jgi:PAS domain S-box-containing protein